ncbi:MAG: ATP-dependent endonuclease [Candidatus Methylomirabilis sp.]|nr:ATP-dependent endonuclease [Deltaproteobacteria bacterium]
MYLDAYKIKNFRRLKDVLITLEKDISIFVGANNSGKTSATHLLQLFIQGAKEKLTVYDFSANCLDKINEIGAQIEAGSSDATADQLPCITVDLWFSVQENDLGRVVDLLPSLEWAGTHVGIRISFGPSDPNAMIQRYLDAREKKPKTKDEKDQYDYLPNSLVDYLRENIGREFNFKYYVLDRNFFNDSFAQKSEYEPLLLTSEKGRTGPQIIKNLLRVDCLDAQRHLSDNSAARSENLSRCLSRFYSRNLKKREDDPEVQEALAKAKAGLDSHFATVFGPTLGRLSDIGYPGLGNPRLMIRSALNPSAIMTSHDGATVHYALERKIGGTGESHILPDRYNGLGFKNLIYMVIELLDIHAQWLDPEADDQPPLHLVFIEEPEAHLHTQLQQVFTRKILDILKIEKEQADYFTSQLVLTTHSPHILFERGFKPIRYFRKLHTDDFQVSEVLNLSKLYEEMGEPDRDFLERYMRLSHCDLFFADAAILVEGNVERLLMPIMIEKAAQKLKSSSICILEIGGAFGHRFKKLIEYLGIVSLIITDLDSIGVDAESGASPDDDNEEEEDSAALKACLVSTAGAVTSNQTLKQWLPGMENISDLISATDEQKTRKPDANSPSHIRVAYQKPRVVTWGMDSMGIAGRTFEEDFAYENLAWCQNPANKSVKLFVTKSAEKNLLEMSKKIFSKVKSSSFNKTDFALAVLEKKPSEWQVPSYISESLKWLEEQLVSPVEEITTKVDEASPMEAEK